MTTMISRDRNSGWLEVRRAFELHTQGKIEQAIDGYRAALVKNPAMAGAWYALGCAELARGAYGRAVPCFRRAISLRRGWAMAELDLGKALFSLGRVDAALTHIRRASTGTRPVGSPPSFGLSGGYRPRRCAGRQPRGPTIAPGLGETRGSIATPIATRPRARSGTKIRVGYVSAFFGLANWYEAGLGRGESSRPLGVRNSSIRRPRWAKQSERLLRPSSRPGSRHHEA